MDPRLWELFNRLGLGPTATQFWQAARAGDFARAEQLLERMQQVLSKSGNLRAAAGTLARMRQAISGVMETAEVGSEAAGDALALTDEGATLMAGGGGAAAGEAGVAGAGGVVLADEAPLAAGGPPGWAIIAVTIVVIIVIAAVAAHADTPPKQQQPQAPPPPPPPMPRRNPFNDLPPNLRFSSKTNPAMRLKHGAPGQFKKYQEMMKKNCRCHGMMQPLGGNLAGRELAMSNTMPKFPCTWPNCPAKSA